MRPPRSGFSPATFRSAVDHRNRLTTEAGRKKLETRLTAHREVFDRKNGGNFSRKSLFLVCHFTDGRKKKQWRNRGARFVTAVSTCNQFNVWRTLNSACTVLRHTGEVHT